MPGWASRQEVALAVAGDGRSNHLVAGAMLSLSNPQNITFWLGMSGTIIGIGFLDPQPVHLLVFFVGFMTAQVCWCFFFATVVENRAPPAAEPAPLPLHQSGLRRVSGLYGHQALAADCIDDLGTWYRINDFACGQFRRLLFRMNLKDYNSFFGGAK